MVAEHADIEFQASYWCWDGASDDAIELAGWLFYKVHDIRYHSKKCFVAVRGTVDNPLINVLWASHDAFHDIQVLGDPAPPPICIHPHHDLK